MHLCVPILYIYKHEVKFSTSDEVKCTYDHILAYVRWKQKHPHEDYYGISATVCVNIYEPSSVCSIIPVHRPFVLPL